MGAADGENEVGESVATFDHFSVSVIRYSSAIYQKYIKYYSLLSDLAAASSFSYNLR